MVPSNFTVEDVKHSRNFLISNIVNNSRFVNKQVLGNPFVFYKDLAAFLSYQIESESDGDRMGIISGLISELEFSKTGLLLSAILISKEYMRPGPGFYKLASSKGLFQINGKKPDPDGLDELDFWNNQVKKIVEQYGKK
jgi:hypothetical protein